MEIEQVDTAAGHQRPDAGFTLVEMSVAMLVLAIGFAALGTFLITSVGQQYSNELRSQAVQLAQQSVEEGRALPWELTGFYADDAQATGCGASGGPTVSIAVPASPTPKSPRVPTAGPKNVTVNGTSYVRTVCYRWLDDPADGVGPADTNGTEDVKRVEVSVTWTVRGELESHTVQAVRAPTSSEVTPRSATGAPAFGITGVTPDPAGANAGAIDAAGKLTAPVTFTATTTPGVATVQLRWTAADGSAQVRTLTVGANSTSWSVTLPIGTTPFAPVQTTFTFTAFSATGETSNQDTRVTFSSTPGSLAITSLAATPNSIDVNSSGSSAVAFTVTATTNADASSAVVRYTNRSGGQVTVTMTASGPRSFSHTFPVGSGPFAEGTTQMSVSATGIGGTATSATPVTFVPPAIVPVALVSRTVAPQLCVENSDGRVLRMTNLDVVVEGLSTTDGVKVQLNDTANTKVDATYLSSSDGKQTFRYTFAAPSTLRFAKGELAASVTATRKSDNTQATQLYTSPIFLRNGTEACPT